MKTKKYALEIVEIDLKNHFEIMRGFETYGKIYDYELIQNNMIIYFYTTCWMKTSKPLPINNSATTMSIQVCSQKRK